MSPLKMPCNSCKRGPVKMPSERNEAEEMKEFMTLLMDVKVTLAEQSGKLDSVLESVMDTKKKVDQTYDIAQRANNRSKENEKDIKDLNDELEKRASKDDVNKRNNIRDGIAFGALIISAITAASAFFM